MFVCRRGVGEVTGRVGGSRLVSRNGSVVRGPRSAHPGIQWRGESPGGDVITGGSAMHIQDTHWSTASAVAAGGGAMGAAVGGRGEDPRSVRTTPLRVDAQRNLEHVLRAAREVFGELG